MNKLAAINSAIEEVNKQAFLAAVGRGLMAAKGLAAKGFSKAKSFIRPPPVVSAGGAAAAAQQAGKAMPIAAAAKPGLASRALNNPYAIGTSIAAPMVFKPVNPPIPT